MPTPQYLQDKQAKKDKQKKEEVMLVTDIDCKYSFDSFDDMYLHEVNIVSNAIYRLNRYLREYKKKIDILKQKEKEKEK